MGISQAMYTGVSGLTINADGMSVIANNIANANSKGFKRDRAEFEDLLSVDLGTGNSQLGRGAKLREIKTIHSQGGLQVTDSLTDLAIQGQGFFIVSNPNTEVQESAGKFYTRVGSFQFDKDGYLSDAIGSRVQGYIADVDGNLTSRLSDVRIQTSNVPPAATRNVMMNVNLDSRKEPLEIDFDINAPEKTSNFSNTISIFDSQGRTHQMTVWYNRIPDDEGISWQWRATVDGKEVSDSDGPIKQIANGSLKFDQKGNLIGEETEASEVNFVGGALPQQLLKFDFGKNMGEEGGNGVNASTCIAAKSNTQFHNQDGFESGNLKSLKIGLDGVVTGLFTNGLQKTIGALAIGNFENQNGLQKAGRNMFYATQESGPAKIGLPQTGTRGSIYSSSLEESNVDLATEFVNMIMTQRAFQANSRSITTTDTMVEEVVNLKR